jgi:two-component system cell cycle response regulator DivK
MKADRERSQAAGCDAYIVKPLRYKELYDVMDELLREPRPPDPPATPPGQPST